MIEARVSPTETKVSGQNVRKIVNDLKYWTSYPFLETPTFLGLDLPVELYALFVRPKDLYAHDVACLIKVGFAEGIASKMSTLVMLDKNQDGNIEATEEMEASGEDISVLVDGYLSLFQNVGVIAALMISVIFPLTLAAGTTVSQDSIDYFGNSCAKAFFYIYLILVNVVVLLSLHVMFLAIHMYKHLSFWMSTPKAKLTWIKTMDVVSFIVKGSVVMFIMTCAIPFGAVSLGGPIPGLISSSVVVGFWIGLRKFSLIENEAMRILYHEAKEVVEKYEKRVHVVE